MASTAQTTVHRGHHLRLAVTAVAVLAAPAALAVPGSASGQAATAQPMASVAAAVPAPGAFHGFVLTDGRYATLDVPGATKTVVGGINDRGQIAGQYTDGGGEHGFVRDPRGRSMRIDVPGARSTSAAKINDRGQVVGYYTTTTLLEDPAARRRGYRLAGRPVPSSACRFGHHARMISPVRHPSMLRWKADAISSIGTGARPGLKGPNCS